MKRATRINLLLIGIVAVFGCLIYLQIEKEVAQFEPPLTAIDTSSVDRITVRCLQCVERRFERRNGHWNMQEPYAMPADEIVLERLLAIAGAQVRLRHAGDAFDLHKIGLDPPQMSITFGAVSIDIGATDALRGDRYVRINDSIAMVPDRFSPFIAALPETELDRHLVTRGSELRAIRVNGIERNERLADWSTAVAQKIRAPTNATDADAAIRIELTLSNDEHIEYHVRRASEGYIARRSEPDLDYSLSEAQMQSLLGETLPRAD